MAFAAALTEKRGPRVGDAASLWNFTPAPGWTREEVQILRLCLMKYGVGQWLQILGTGLLPGKLIQQLNGQTQRLLGQQSLAAFTGLRVDVDRVRGDNEARADATRKAGLIIYDGPLLTKEMKAELREEALRKYGLTMEQQQKVDEQMEELAAAYKSATVDVAEAHDNGPGAVFVAEDWHQTISRLDPELGAVLALPPEELNPEQSILLLKHLRNRLASLVNRHRRLRELPPRPGPRWAGEADADALITAMANAAAAAAVTLDATAGSGGRVADVASTGQPGTSGCPGPARQLLAEAAACRVRSGTNGGTAAAPAPTGAARKRNKPGKSRPSGGDEMDWSEGEENVGRCGLPRRTGAATAGSKRKASGGGGTPAEGANSRRAAARSKRPVARYDTYIDDGEYDEEDPGAVRGGPVVDPNEAISQLTAMGFTERKARGALRECHFNVEAAVEWLFANCV